MLSFSRCRYSILRGMSKSPICTKILDTLNSSKILEEILVNFCVHRQKVWTPLTMTRKWRKNFSRPCRQPRKFGHSWHRARKFWTSLKGGAKIQEESWTSCQRTKTGGDILVIPYTERWKLWTSLRTVANTSYKFWPLLKSAEISAWNFGHLCDKWKFCTLLKSVENCSAWNFAHP